MAVQVKSPGAHSTAPRLSRDTRIRLLQLALLIFLIVAWEVTGRRIGSFVLVPPSALVQAFIGMLASGELMLALRDSLSGLLLGYAIAIVTGVTVGTLMGWYPRVAIILNPFVSALYAIPIAALVPLLLLWLGIGTTARIVTIALFAVFEILISTYTGVREVDKRLIEMAHSYGASQRQLFTKIVFFDALPVVFAGLRIGAGRSVKGMIVAELLFAVTGLGGLVLRASSNYQTAKILAVVVIVSLIGVLLVTLMQFIERRIAPWYHRSR
jgi:NitT/TauT family transport system permease protein